jgi:hypothetical protein
VTHLSPLPPPPLFFFLVRAARSPGQSESVRGLCLPPAGAQASPWPSLSERERSRFGRCRPLKPVGSWRRARLGCGPAVCWPFYLIGKLLEPSARRPGREPEGLGSLWQLSPGGPGRPPPGGRPAVTVQVIASGIEVITVTSGLSPAPGPAAAVAACGWPRSVPQDAAAGSEPVGFAAGIPGRRAAAAADDSTAPRVRRGRRES